MLKQKDGYSFSKDVAMTVNWESVKSSLSGEFLYAPAVKTITMPTIKVIDVVEVNDVTVSFKDGDKPVFTGNTPDGVNYMFRCEWWELDSTTGLVSTEPGWGSGIYENKITAFEAGETYHYGVYVTAVGYVESENTTYVFGPNTKLKINGKFVDYKQYEGYQPDFPDGTTMSMWVLTDIAMTPEAGGTVPAEKYTVTYTDGVDGEEVFADQTYTVESGATTPEFSGTPTRDGYVFAGWSPSFAATVTGDVTYKATWKAGQAPAGDDQPSGEAQGDKAQDEEAPSEEAPSADEAASADEAQGEEAPSADEAALPKTGDTSGQLIALLFAGGSAAIGAAVVDRRRLRNR